MQTQSALHAGTKYNKPTVCAAWDKTNFFNYSKEIKNIFKKENLEIKMTKKVHETYKRCAAFTDVIYILI